MEKLCTVNKTRPGADCGSDHKLLITNFRLKLKKAGKTARPFRYDLNQIPYDYTVEVRNRFKGARIQPRWIQGDLKGRQIGEEKFIYLFN